MLLTASDVQRSEHKQLQLSLLVPVQYTGLLAAHTTLLLVLYVTQILR